MRDDWRKAYEKCEFLVFLHIKDIPDEVLRKHQFQHLDDIVLNICGTHCASTINDVWSTFMDGEITATYAVKYLMGEINERNKN